MPAADATPAPRELVTTKYLRELTPKSVTLGTGDTGEQTTIKVSAAGLERVLQRMRR